MILAPLGVSMRSILRFTPSHKMLTSAHWGYQQLPGAGMYHCGPSSDGVGVTKGDVTPFTRLLPRSVQDDNSHYPPCALRHWVILVQRFSHTTALWDWSWVNNNNYPISDLDVMVITQYCPNNSCNALENNYIYPN